MLVVGLCGLAHARSYTLPELAERVRDQSPTLVAERATLALRRAQRLEQELRWLPDGDATFYVSEAPNVRCNDVPEQWAPTDALRKLARENDCLTTNIVDRATSSPGVSAADRAPFHGALLNFSISLRQPLFTSLKIESAIRAARAGTAAEAENLRGVELDVALSAVQIYAQLKTARGTLGALDRAVGSLERFLAFIEQELDGKNRSGFVEGDSLRLRTQVANLRITRADAQRTYAASLEALRAITGDPDAVLDEDDLDAPAMTRDDPDAWRARMQTSRPELLSAHKGIDYFRQLVRVNRGFALPDLVLVTGASAGYAPTFDTPSLGFANLPVSSASALIGMALHQPLSIGPKVARTEQAQHDWAMQRLRLELGAKAWGLEVDKAWLDLQEATRRRDELEHGLRVVEGWYATVDQQLTLGVRADGRELMEVVINWVSFEVRTLQARSDAVVALAALRRASGQAVVP